MHATQHTRFRMGIEFGFIWLLIHLLRLPPRGVARRMSAGLTWLAWVLLPRLRQVGMRNLQIAFPAQTESQHKATLRGLYRTLGWQIAEFCQMAKYTAPKASKFIEYDGLQNYRNANAKGKGVLVVTGHLGAWELSSFFHSLNGYPMGMVIRRLDNPLVDQLVNQIRCMHGNKVLHKDDFARALLGAMRAGETVGILMDTNMTPPQGVFVPFFGVQACTASGLARVALKTGAAVLPGCLMWDAARKKYILHFGEEMALVRSEDAEADIIANTAMFTAAIESYIRRYPDQWLWVHRRWKTRPAGEPPIY
ncbi:MAG TPA: lysophospholipid acyltransferase family protein [Acidobacteriaceae bacterium]